MGDILSSLYFCVELTAHFEQKQFDYCLLINKKESDFKKNSVTDEILLTGEKAEFIRPLLESLPFINQVTVREEPEDGMISLNDFRRGVVCPCGCEIRDWYYTFSGNTLPRASTASFAKGSNPRILSGSGSFGLGFGGSGLS